MGVRYLLIFTLKQHVPKKLTFFCAARTCADLTEQYNKMELKTFFKDTVKALDDFKNKQHKCMKQCFLVRKSIYILKVYSFRYTLR